MAAHLQGYRRPAHPRGPGHQARRPCGSAFPLHLGFRPLPCPGHRQPHRGRSGRREGRMGLGGHGQKGYDSGSGIPQARQRGHGARVRGAAAPGRVAWEAPTPSPVRLRLGLEEHRPPHRHSRESGNPGVGKGERDGIARRHRRLQAGSDPMGIRAQDVQRWLALGEPDQVRDAAARAHPASTSAATTSTTSWTGAWRYRCGTVARSLSSVRCKSTKGQELAPTLVGQP